MRDSTRKFFDSMNTSSPSDESDVGAFPATAFTHSPEALAAMPHAELLAYAQELQRVYGQLESENRFLAWEFKEFQDNYTYFSRATKLAHRLNASDVDTVASLAVNEIPEYFNCRFAAFFLYEQDSQILRLYRVTQPFPQTVPVHRENDAGNFLVHLLFGRTKPFIFEYDSDQDLLIVEDETIHAPIAAEWQAALGKRGMVFPLYVSQAENTPPLFLGGLLLGDSVQELKLSDADVAVVFADLLASSLNNARLVQKLNELTIIDPLTNIYNRRHLMNQLTRAMTQARRHSHPLSLAMLDIDNFKHFNDTHGHLCGDEVLRDVGSLLRHSIRKDIDIPARYGGEEFMLVMPYTGLDEAVRVAERIREKVREHVCLFDGKELVVTCSFGVAEYDGAEELEHFIERTDDALYQAKNQGRDRVHVDRSTQQEAGA